MSAVNVAIIAATASHAAERKLLEKLRDRGAVDARRAETIDHLGKKERPLVDALAEKGLVTRIGDDRIHLTAKGRAALEKKDVNGGMVALTLLVGSSFLLAAAGLAIALG